MEEEQNIQDPNEITRGNQNIQPYDLTPSHVPSHTHNGVDSPRIRMQDIQGAIVTAKTTYAGSDSVLPTGWTIAHPSLGHYVITHNLNTVSYAVTANSFYGAGGGMIAIATALNSFNIDVYNETGTNWIDSSFNFILTKF